jgi:hypothetical protein
MFRVTDTDAEQEPARVLVLDAVIRLGDKLGRGCPHVDDAGGHLKCLGGVQQRFDVFEIAWR